MLMVWYCRHKIDFTPHPGVSAFEKGGNNKGVMYQMNPLPNWGPAMRAKTTTHVPKGSTSGGGAVAEKRSGEVLEKEEPKKVRTGEGGAEEEEAFNG
jgi:hypothetical protein